MATYDIRLDFEGGFDDEDGDFECDPPHIFITANGQDFLEILLDPSPFDNPDCDDGDWQIPDEAMRVLRLLQGVKVV